MDADVRDAVREGWRHAVARAVRAAAVAAGGGNEEEDEEGAIARVAQGGDVVRAAVVLARHLDEDEDEDDAGAGETGRALADWAWECASEAGGRGRRGREGGASEEGWRRVVARLAWREAAAGEGGAVTSNVGHV